jgi:hypothetical protein
MEQGEKVKHHIAGWDTPEAEWVWMGLVSGTKQGLTPESEKALWVEYKKLPIWGLDILLGR